MSCATKALALFVVAAWAATPATVAKTKTVGTWSAPEAGPAKFAKVLVLARFTEDTAKRTLEDAVVAKLKKAGIEAVAAYQVLGPEDLVSGEAIEAKAGPLGIDAGLVFAITGDKTTIKAESNVRASVGVPVRVGPFSIFVGSSVPLGGRPSPVRTVAVSADFHTTQDTGPRWIGNFAIDPEDGPERTGRDLAAQAIKHLKRAGMLK